MPARPDQLKRCKQGSAKSVQFDLQEIDVTGMRPAQPHPDGWRHATQACDRWRNQ